MLTNTRKKGTINAWFYSRIAFTLLYSLHNKSNCDVIKWYEVIHRFLEAYLLLHCRRSARSINQRSSKIYVVVPYLFFLKFHAAGCLIKDFRILCCPCNAHFSLFQLFLELMCEAATTKLFISLVVVVRKEKPMFLWVSKTFS